MGEVETAAEEVRSACSRRYDLPVPVSDGSHGVANHAPFMLGASRADVHSMVGSTPTSVEVLLIGCRSADSDALRDLLDRSTSHTFHVTCCPRVAMVRDDPACKSADLMLLDVSDESNAAGRIVDLQVQVPGLPVVALGVSEDEEFAHQLMHEGARGYLAWSELSTRLLVTTLAAALQLDETVRRLTSTLANERELTTIDQLTGLANRTAFIESVDRAVTLAESGRETIAVLYLDLDGFKYVNDGLGHAVGDGILRGVARRLKSCVGELGSVARVGGDEFAILLRRAESESEITAFAERVLTAVGKPLPLCNSISTRAEIGIAIYPKHASNGEDLIRHADTAMFAAKKRGRHAFEFYSKRLNDAVLSRVSLENGLRSVVGDGGLVLHYQPQFDIRRKRIVGAEALLRWSHPEFGLLAPTEFLPLAKQTRTIVEIGEWVLQEGCRQAAEWQRRGLVSLRLGLNVASEQFHSPGLAEALADALGDSGVRPDSIEIEITESSLLEDIEATTETLNAFDRLGVRLALDDFGTGYSSLAYLKRLPIDTVKIDQCFVHSLVADAADAAITQAIVSLAHELNMSTTAEGVENLDQLLLLGSYGCNRMQGFLFGRPAPVETFESWLDDPPFHWGSRLEGS